MRVLSISSVVVATGLVLGAASGAQAEVIFSYGGPITQRTDGGIVAGSTFTAYFGQVVSALGFVDVGNDGLAGSYTVGLWGAGQNLIASAVVTPSAPLINGFRYAAISPVVLPNGQAFTIAALLPTTPSDPWLDNANVSLGAGYTGSGAGEYVASGTLVFPTTNVASSYVIVNAGDFSIPEPGTLGGLAVGVVGLLARRRVRRG